MKIGLLWLAVLATALCLKAQEGWPPALQKTFEQGVAAEKAGKLDQAEKAFLLVLSQGMDASFVHNNLGIVYQRRGDHRRAIQEFRQALKIEPTYAQPRALLGVSLLAVGRVKQALTELNKAVKQLPAEPLVRLSLARAYARTGNLEAEVDQLRVLRKLVPREPEYAYLLGQAYTQLSAWYYKRIRRLDPTSARYYQSIGENDFLRGAYRQAINALQRAARADPSLPGIHLTLARIYLQQGKRAAALQEVNRELAVMPASFMALRLRHRLTRRPAASRQ